MSVWDMSYLMTHQYIEPYIKNKTYELCLKYQIIEK